MQLKPYPTGKQRANSARKIRKLASKIRDRIRPAKDKNNKEIFLYGNVAPATFTKGLPHNKYGLAKKNDLNELIEFINQERPNEQFEFEDPEGYDVPHGVDKNFRPWESPLAGHVYSIMGADAGELAIPPAPRIGSGELIAEMAEVYALALLRDISFEDISAGKGEAGSINACVKKISWFKADRKSVV